MKRQEKMAEAEPNTDFLTDVGFNIEMARKLLTMGVTQFEDLADIDPEHEDFKKLNLTQLQRTKFLKQWERAKKLQEFKNMTKDCREELQGKGLTLETLLELDKRGVVNINSLIKGVTEPIIAKMNLLPAQKTLLKTIVSDFKPQQVAEGGGIHVKGVIAEYGIIADRANVGIVKGDVPKEGKVVVEDFKQTANVVSNAVLYVVDTTHPPHEFISLVPAKPKDLKLETTDWLLETMTDGPLSPDFNVKNCEKAFYDKNKNDAYSMEKTPRGRVLVINVNKVEGQEPRTGTDVDRDKLKTLFEQLHFAVTVFNDEDGLGAEEIRDKVKAFADKANREKGEAYVVCLLSHGKGDCLYGTDGKLLPFDTVFSLFDDGNCPDLVGRPKIFLIQACRTEEPSLGRLPTKKGGRSNMVVCYATQAGYEAFRNTTNGSWFIEGVTKIFAHFADQEDIIYMMYRVHYLVQKKLKLKTAENISPEVRLTLNKKLLFFPGIQK